MKRLFILSSQGESIINQLGNNGYWVHTYKLS